MKVKKIYYFFSSSKLNAGALLYSIAISLVVFIMCSILILLKYLSMSLFNDVQNQEHALTNFNSIIELMESGKFTSQKNKISIDLFGEKKDSIFIEFQEWGIYDIAKIESKYINKEVTKIVLLGDRCFSKRPSIYYVNKGHDLFITGKSLISGDCWVPNGLIKTTFIKGISFIGNKPIEGSSNFSAESLPDPSTRITKFVPFQTNISTDSIVFYENSTEQTIRNSFRNRCLILFSKKAIKLDKRILKGNIKVVSEKEISVDQSSILNDLILEAPNIKIGSNFFGNIQCYATDSIILLNNVVLEFPSSLIVNGTQRSNIKLNSDCQVRGSIVLISNEDKNNCILNLDSNTLIVGDIYCQGKIELRSKVIGSILTNGLVYRIGSSIFENVIVNSTINSISLPSQFVDGSLIDGEFPKGVIKCLE
jgi:hypothetical protein